MSKDELIRQVEILAEEIRALKQQDIFSFTQDNISVFKQVNVLDSAPSLVILKDLEGRYLYVNKIWERLVGQSCEAVLGKTPHDIFPPEVADFFLNKERETFETAAPHCYEASAPTAKGMTYALTYSFPLLDTEGSVYAVCVMAIDITKLKEAETKLKQSKIVFRKVFEGLREAIFIVDEQSGIIHDCNQAAASIFGYNREEMIGRNVSFLFVSPVQAAEFHRIMKATIDMQGYYHSPDHIMLHKNGDKFHTDNHVTEFTNMEGMPAGWIWTLRDITPQKNHELELSAANERLEQRVAERTRELTEINTRLRREINERKRVEGLAQNYNSLLKERYCLKNIVGRSAPMLRIFNLLEQLSQVDASILITGESGTGKGLIAEALHFASNRASGPLVRVNCSALPETLLESELFGHVKGAFTGADRDRAGRFEAAVGGTLFLDEIGDISPLVQLKLLRVLESKEYERVGESVTHKADVRIIAATNADLQALVTAGTFRHDLYYRLKVMVIDVPPLRERRKDIPLLVTHFIDFFNQTHGKSIQGVSSDVFSIFLEHPWPGNVRQLRHAMEHACILCTEGLIMIDHLPSEFRGMHPHALLSASHSAPEAHQSPQKAPPEQLRIQLEETLAMTGGNKARAARHLGISRNTLYRRMKRLGID